jgi:hypothetical protein
VNLEVKVEEIFPQYSKFIENETFGGTVCTPPLLDASRANLT